jgi:hypothetical protein
MRDNRMYDITLTVKGEWTKDHILTLLNTLKNMGEMGCTRDFISNDSVIPYPENHFGEFQLYWDGDGDAKIRNIEVKEKT